MSSLSRQSGQLSHLSEELPWPLPKILSLLVDIDVEMDYLHLSNQHRNQHLHR
jgi:hypothetical protein